MTVSLHEKKYAAAFEVINNQWLESASQLCVLMDPLLGDALLPELTFDGLACYPLPIKHNQLTNNGIPYLLTASDPVMERILSESLHVALLELENTSPPMARSVCGWLTTAMPPKALSQQLASHAIVRDTHHKRRLLRYWDPRVFTAMQHNTSLNTLLPTAQKATTWFAFNENGQLAMQPLAEAPFVPAGEQAALQAAQLAQLLLTTESNAVMTRLKEKLKAPYITVDKARVEHNLQVASQLAFNNDDDKIAFAADRYRTEVPLEAAERMHALIQLCQQGKASYENVTSTWEHATDWVNVIAEARQVQANLRTDKVSGR